MNRRARFLLGALLCVSPGLAQLEPGAETEQGRENLRLIKQVLPTFPVRLQREGVLRGEVLMLIEVDQRGRIVDRLITAFTHAEFAQEAFRVVGEWQFQPMGRMDQPSFVVAPLTFIFEYSGTLVREKWLDSTFLDGYREWRFTYAPCRAKDLDRPPQPAISVQPRYPKALGDEGVTGRITMAFYIDEKGKVRMPMPMGDADARLAGLAAEALRLWEFDPPTRRGRPVLVRAEADFIFEPPK